MAKKKSSRFVDQAALQALIRFGPQLDVLTEAQRTSEDTYKTSVAQARSGASAVQQAVDQARPQVAQIYDRAGLDQARTSDTLIGKDLAGLGNVADSIKGGAAAEAAGMLGRLGESRAAALTDLGERRSQAAAGSVAAQGAALDQLTQDLARIFRSKKDLAGQKGAFEAATVGDLEEAARDRALKLRLENLGNQQSERNSVRSAGVDPDTGKPLKGRGRTTTATGKRALSADKHLEWQTAIQEIQNYAEKYRGKVPRSQVVEALKKGRSKRSGWALEDGTEVEKGTPGAHPFTLESVPAFEPDLRMSAALDVALDGHLSRKTQRKLSDAGFVIRDLGLPTYAEWRRKHPRPRGGAADTFWR